MKHTLILALALGMGILYALSSCADKLPIPPTPLDCSTVTIAYNSHIKRILDANCNLSGCHDNTTQGTFGAYNTLGAFRRTAIYNRVCVAGDMPPSGISQEIIDTIRCWKENGYLENPTLDCSTVTITYDNHVKRILDANCGTTGCHDGTAQAVFGAYNTLDSTRMMTMYNRVCVIGDMPPAGLAQSFVDTIRCWKENGFSQN